MLKFRTTKQVQTSLHTNETHRLEFRFKYHRVPEGMKITVDTYAIDVDDVFLIGGAGSNKMYSLDDLAPLIADASQITDPLSDPIQYMDALVASGIKLAIVSEGYWRNQLTMQDWEV